MRKYILIIATAIIGLAGCQQNKVQDFIPGTYVKTVKGEFGKADDTLTITTSDELHYTISRHTGYQFKQQPVKHKQELLTGTYDAAKQTLTETVKGRSYTFDPKAETLTTARGGVYRKLK